MKKIIFLLALATLTLWATARAQTEAEITYQDFYDGLAPYGDWVYVDGYGYCWQPGVEEGWRPYTNGGWIYTNAGWTWSSDEEMGLGHRPLRTLDVDDRVRVVVGPRL